MTPTEPTVAEVVAGLTKAQRATRVINNLRDKEMLAWVAPSDFYTLAIWRLNNLGLAVREHLLAKEVGK